MENHNECRFFHAGRGMEYKNYLNHMLWPLLDTVIVFKVTTLGYAILSQVPSRERSKVMRSPNPNQVPI